MSGMNANNKLPIKTWRLCEPLKSDDDVTNFYSSVCGNFEGAVQYNKDNKAFEVVFSYNLREKDSS